MTEQTIQRLFDKLENLQGQLAKVEAQLAVLDTGGGVVSECYTPHGGWAINQDGFFFATPFNAEIKLDDSDNQLGLQTESQSIIGAINELAPEMIKVTLTDTDFSDNEASVPGMTPGFWEIYSLEMELDDDDDVTILIYDGSEPSFSMRFLVADTLNPVPFSKEEKTEALGLAMHPDGLAPNMSAHARPVIFRTEDETKNKLDVFTGDSTPFTLTLRARKIIGL